VIRVIPVESHAGAKPVELVMLIVIDHWWPIGEMSHPAAESGQFG